MLVLVGVSFAVFGAVFIIVVGPNGNDPPPRDAVGPLLHENPIATKSDVSPGERYTFANGSLVVIVSQQTAGAEVPLVYEQPQSGRLPTLPAGFSKPITYFRLGVHGADGIPLKEAAADPATVSVRLDKRALEAANGNPFQLSILRYDAFISSWVPTPSSVDLPWLRAKITLDSLGLFAMAANEDQGNGEFIDEGLVGRSLQGLWASHHQEPFQSDLRSAAVPVPVASPTEAPRPEPRPVAAALLPTLTPTPTPDPTPTPSMPVPIAAIPSPIAATPSPVSSPSPPPTPIQTPTKTPTSSPTATPEPRFRLFINGRQVLASDKTFLVPLGIVRLLRLPEPDGRFREGTHVEFNVEVNTRGTGLQIVGADAVNGTTATLEMIDDRFVWVYILARPTATRTPTATPTPTPTATRTPTRTFHAYANRYKETYGNARGYAYNDPDTHSHRYGNSYGHTNSYPHPNSNPSGRTDRFSNGSGWQ